MKVKSADRAQTIAFDAVVQKISGERGVMASLREMRNLAASAESAPPEHAFAVLSELANQYQQDALASYLAIHAMARVKTLDVDRQLERFLDVGHPDGIRQHAAWALSQRRPSVSAITALVQLAGDGGFSQMMAELALENWFQETPELVWRLDGSVSPEIRRLAETVTRRKDRVGNRVGNMRIAQVLMQGKVDGGLTATSSGDGGGLITLQVGLTSRISAHDDVAETFLVTRRLTDEDPIFAKGLEQISEGGSIVRLDFGPGGYVPVGDLWAYRADLGRELKRFFHDKGPFDAIHLRFADVGTFAAALVAHELEIPVFFTLAPDPHAVIRAGEREGWLNRNDFAAIDLKHHFFFRAWLVDWMLKNATRLALLPRRDQKAQFEELLGIDIEEESERFTVIPEGVDFSLAEQARRQAGSVSSALLSEPVVRDLVTAVAGLGEERHGLPLLVSVGRLNRVKGLDRVVEAWHTDLSLKNEFNLVVLGGNLDNPSPEESVVLDRIEAATSNNDSGRDGLILLGSRPHEEVAVLLATAVSGVPGYVGSHGIYVCGSDKEEFGLAILEAMAAGLPVVAPVVGGPATYVDHGFTGYLADTLDFRQIQAGAGWASGARKSDFRAEASRKKVRNHYSIAAMAEALVDLYQPQEPKRSAG